MTLAGTLLVVSPGVCEFENFISQHRRRGDADYFQAAGSLDQLIQDNKTLGDLSALG